MELLLGMDVEWMFFMWRTDNVSVVEYQSVLSVDGYACYFFPHSKGDHSSIGLPCLDIIDFPDTWLE